MSNADAPIIENTYRKELFELGSLVNGNRARSHAHRSEEIDGVEHFVISMGLTADSHPFFTGQSTFVDTEGRIDKFQKRFGTVRRAKKPTRAQA